MNILEPVWVSVFTTDTFACIKNRGIHGTMKKVKAAMEDADNTKYCLKIDIRKFYPSIDHDCLKEIIRRKIKCKDTLWLLDQVIDSAPGVPIGNYLSQYFANLYLAYFDHWIKEKKGIKYYFRYADDCVVLHHDKRFLHQLFREIRDYLADNLKLEIKRNWQVFPVASRGIDFVGYVFFHTHTRLRKSIKITFCRKVAGLMKRKALTEEKFKQSICPYWGWAKYCDSIHLINKLSKNSKYEIKFKR
jgi:hypothetical protein